MEQVLKEIKKIEYANQQRIKQEKKDQQRLDKIEQRK